MKNAFLFLALSALALSCRFSGEDSIQTGDLIFLGFPKESAADQGGMTAAIASATGEGDLNLVHVGILEVDAENTVWVIDATVKNGVHRDTLSQLIRDFTRHDGTLPVALVMRLKDNSHAKEYVQKAKSFIGEPYDYNFAPDNGAQYCSELVWDSYIRADGTRIFETTPMNFKNEDGEFDLYWIRLFERLQVPIPQDEPGTCPQEIYASEALRPVNITLIK